MGLPALSYISTRFSILTKKKKTFGEDNSVTAEERDV